MAIRTTSFQRMNCIYVHTTASTPLPLSANNANWGSVTAMVDALASSITVAFEMILRLLCHQYRNWLYTFPGSSVAVILRTRPPEFP